MKKITIIGSGSWGCALAINLGIIGHEIKIWSYDEEEKNLINNEKKCKFLPKVKMPDNIFCTNSFEEALEKTDIVLHVTPSKFTRETVKQYKKFIKNQVVVICSKGFEKDSLKTLDEVVAEELPNTKIAVLSGPSHAEEVSIEVPTALVVASKHQDVCEMIQEEFMTKSLRIYSCNDVRGVELGGALKNIIAFCAGVGAGVGLGDNSFAALITRGLKEISELGVALGGEKNTFYGLTGLGDLIVTCLSEHSRNRKAGYLVGKGKSIDEARKEVGMVIESIDNIEVAYELGKRNNIEMPILNTVYDILYNDLSPKEAVSRLMNREKKSEF